MHGTDRNEGSGPLEGIRVLDFSHAAAGPFVTMLLADMGAEVIKIEKPGRGDGSRYMGEPMLGALESDYYLGLNRSKRSVLLDLQKPEALELALRLASQSDVLVQNFRPRVMERLGLGYDAVKAVSPGIVYCSISAFGSSGPWTDRPANDIIMQSVSGLMGITGEVGGGPVRIGAPISDYATGLFALAGILLALFDRNRQPGGQHIEIAMLDASLAMMANYIPSVVTLNKRIPRLGRGHAQIVPYQAFMCSDGQYVMVGAFTNGFWRRLCEAVGKKEWLKDERFESNEGRLEWRDELLNELAAIFKTGTRDQWMRILEEADVPNSPVLELDEAVRSEQALHNGCVQHVVDEGRILDVIKNPIQSDRWRSKSPTMPPAMGDHTDQVLKELLDLSSAEIDHLETLGAIKRAEGPN